MTYYHAIDGTCRRKYCINSPVNGKEYCEEHDLSKLPETFDQMKSRHNKEMREFFAAAIDMSGSKRGAAELLGIDRRLVQRVSKGAYYTISSAKKPNDL